ncbi:MAG: hypothetical protein M3R44_00065 [Candidatus Eremiobacteraeota bacterium]|nr:hypothetical protein [Candidatus Eremiobacteraeota bacterium]
MSDFGDIIGSIFGGGGGAGDAGQGVSDLVAGLFEGTRENQNESGAEAFIPHERYLCGGPKTLNINDR